MTAMAPMLAVYAMLAVALLVTSGSAAVVSTEGKGARKALRPTTQQEPQGVVQPLSFRQELLVCNAYPSDAPMTVKQNGEAALSTEHNSVLYQNCEHISSNIHAKDKLDFDIEGSGIQGTFEVGDLPDSDATLLLVVEKRDAKTPLVAFQSFAFPWRAEGKTAQLAVIDTYKGNSSMPHLKMEDHIAGKEQRTISKRVEELNFNRIYAVEEGMYDASITDRVQSPKDMAMIEERVTAKRTLHLTKSQNYVILRTGDDKHFPQSLVVFPPEMRSGAMMGMVSRACLSLLLLGLAVNVA
jgi:hypothetical protein